MMELAAANVCFFFTLILMNNEKMDAVVYQEAG